MVNVEEHYMNQEHREGYPTQWMPHWVRQELVQGTCEMMRKNRYIYVS